MPELNWDSKLTFSTVEEYYETLGFLCKEEDRPIDIYIEDNRPAGAWGVERRLSIGTRIDKAYIPAPLGRLFTRTNRQSVKNYFLNLQTEHRFTRTAINPGTANTTHYYPTSYADVVATVPAEYINDFNRGYYWSVELQQLIRTRSVDTNDDGDVVSELTGDIEGKKTGYYTTKYERSKSNRDAAIHAHGTICEICGFDFSATYGDLGIGYIEVHHKKALSTLDEAVVVDPVNDMACVCANCHRMLHRYKKYILGIEELKMIVENNR